MVYLFLENVPIGDTAYKLIPVIVFAVVLILLSGLIVFYLSKSCVVQCKGESLHTGKPFQGKH